jgi:hypothetical protein
MDPARSGRLQSQRRVEIRLALELDLDGSRFAWAQ